jgi:subtilisin family serine protease
MHWAPPRHLAHVPLLAPSLPPGEGDTLFFAAASNEGNSSFSAPAIYSNVSSVAALDSVKMGRAWFSNYNSKVEFAAPGGGLPTV